MLSEAKKYKCWEKETKKFLLLSERIVYCFAQKLIVQEQHDSKRSLLLHRLSPENGEKLMLLHFNLRVFNFEY